MVMSKEKHPNGSFEELRSRARELRKKATLAENLLWEQLRNRRLNGIKFRRQHILSPYIVDFYCPAHRLVIEIDGEVHNFQKEYDLSRTTYFEEKNIKVLRFWNNEIEQDIDTVLDKIIEACTLPSPRIGRRGGDEGDL